MLLLKEQDAAIVPQSTHVTPALNSRCTSMCLACFGTHQESPHPASATGASEAQVYLEPPVSNSIRVNILCSKKYIFGVLPGKLARMLVVLKAVATAFLTAFQRSSVGSVRIVWCALGPVNCNQTTHGCEHKRAQQTPAQHSHPTQHATSA